jgi:hypothetical protein
VVGERQGNALLDALLVGTVDEPGVEAPAPEFVTGSVDGPPAGAPTGAAPEEVAT